jgi:acyl carrier protein
MTNDQQAILDILAQHAQCARDAIDAASELTDLGIDSLKFIVVVLEIEQRLDRGIFDIDNVGQLRTVGDILDLAALA